MDSVDVANAIFDEIDIDPLYKRLSVFAWKLSCQMPHVFDGISPDDLVGEAVLTFLSSETRLGWDPRKANLDRFLCGVVKNLFLTHARLSRRCAGSRRT